MKKDLKAFVTANIPGARKRKPKKAKLPYGFVQIETAEARKAIEKGFIGHYSGMASESHAHEKSDV